MSGNKNLSDELATVIEELKEMHNLKEKVKVLEKEIVTLKNNKAYHKEADQDSQSIQCRKCKRNYPTKKQLKEHILVSHPTKIDCDHCERTFSSKYELETHADQHGLHKNFKCDTCDKHFYLEWRLNKHTHVHHENTKYCHYFSSQKTCPFEAVGCMYRHDDLSQNSDKDKHLDEENDNEQADKNEFDTVEETIATQEYDPFGFSTGPFANCAEHFPCNLCKFTSPSSTGLNEHFQRKHTQMPNQTFGYPILYQGLMPSQANGVSYAHCGRPGGQF